MPTRLQIKRGDSYNLSPDVHLLYDGEPAFTRYTRLSDSHPVQTDLVVSENYLEIGNISAPGGHGKFVNSMDMNVVTNEAFNTLSNINDRVTLLDEQLNNMYELKLTYGPPTGSNIYTHFRSDSTSQLYDLSRLGSDKQLQIRIFNDGDLSDINKRWELTFIQEDDLDPGTSDLYGNPDDEYGRENNLKLTSYGLYGEDEDQTNDVIEVSSKKNKPIKVYKPIMSKRQILTNVEEVLKNGDFEGTQDATGSAVLTEIGWKVPSNPAYFQIESVNYSEPSDVYVLSDSITSIDDILNSTDATKGTISQGLWNDYNSDRIAAEDSSSPTPVYTVGMTKPSGWLFEAVRKQGVIVSPIFSWLAPSQVHDNHEFIDTESFRIENKGFAIKMDSAAFSMEAGKKYLITAYVRKNTYTVGVNTYTSDANVYLSIKHQTMGSSFYNTTDGKKAAFNWDPSENGQIKGYYGNMSKSTYKSALDGWANAAGNEWVKFQYYYTPTATYEDNLQLRITVGTKTADLYQDYTVSETLTYNNVDIGIVKVEEVLGVDQITRNLPPSGGTQTVKFTTKYPGTSTTNPSVYSHFFGLDVNSWYILKMAYKVPHLGAENIIVPNSKSNDGIYRLEWYDATTNNIKVKRADSNNTATEDGLVFSNNSRHFFAWYYEGSQESQFIPKVNTTMRTRIGFQQTSTFDDVNPSPGYWIKIHYGPKISGGEKKFYRSIGDLSFDSTNGGTNRTVPTTGEKGDTYTIGIDRPTGATVSNVPVNPGDIVRCIQDTTSLNVDRWEIIQPTGGLSVADQVYGDYRVFLFTADDSTNVDPKITNVQIGATAVDTMNNFREAFNTTNWGSDYVGWTMGSDPVLDINLYAPGMTEPWLDNGFKYNIAKITTDNLGDTDAWQVLTAFVQPAKTGGNIDTDHERAAVQLEFTKNTVLRPFSIEIDYISLRKLTNNNYVENSNTAINRLKLFNNDSNVVGGELSVVNQGTEIALTRNPLSPIPMLLGITHDTSVTTLKTDARFGIGVRGTVANGGVFEGNQLIAFHSVASLPTPSGRKSTVQVYKAGDGETTVYRINADTGQVVHEGNLQLNPAASFMSQWDTTNAVHQALRGNISINKDSTATDIVSESISKADYKTNSAAVGWPTLDILKKPQNWTINAVRHYTENPHPIFEWDTAVYTQETDDYIPAISYKVYNKGFSIKLDSPAFSMTSRKRYLITVYVRKNTYIDHRNRTQLSNANLYLALYDSTQTAAAFYATADGTNGAFNWDPSETGMIKAYYGSMSKANYDEDDDAWKNASENEWVKFSYYYVPTKTYTNSMKLRITVGTRFADKHSSFDPIEEDLVYNNVNIGYVRVEEVPGIAVIKHGTGNHYGNPVTEATNLITRSSFTFPVSATAPTSPTTGMVYYDETTTKLKFYDGSTWRTIDIY